MNVSTKSYVCWSVDAVYCWAARRLFTIYTAKTFNQAIQISKHFSCWEDMPLAIINLKHNGAGGTTEKFNSISIKLMSKFKLRQIKLNSILFGKNE